MFGVVGEDDLVEGGGAFFVCQTHQQFLPLDARSAVIVADEFGEVEGVVGLFPVHLVGSDGVTVQTGDLTIDYDKHQVLMHGENAGLTVNEYKIVALLGKYAGKVLTYDFIIRELWGPKAKTDNQILRVNMANIRRKLGSRPGKNTYILNELGVGYRMIDEDARSGEINE